MNKDRQRNLLKATATIMFAGAMVACSSEPTTAQGTPEVPPISPFPTHIPTETPRPTMAPIESPIPKITATQKLAETATLESPPTAVRVAEGKFLLFSKNIDGKFDIFRLNLKTGTEENLTNTPDSDEMNAQVSPDGTWAVYYGDQLAQENPGGKNILWKLNLIDNTVTPLTKGIDDKGEVIDQHWYDPTISPNGKTIACKLDQGEENGHGKIYLMDIDGKNIRELRELIIKDKDGNPIRGQMWKPEFNADGTKLYITIGEDDDSELYVANIDGTNAIRLTIDDDSDWFAAQNPVDPNVIAFTSNESGFDEIHIKNVVTGKETRITYVSINNKTDGKGIEIADPAWSKDSKQITAVENDGEQYDVVVMDADGQNLRHVTDTRGKGNNELSPVFIQ
jgi:Tol biopolymer transport system component